MRFELCMENFEATEPIRVGNVYQVRGGRGAQLGYLNILIATRKDDGHCYMLTISRDGSPQGVTHYGAHHVRELQPIGFVDGLDDVSFSVRSI